MTGNALRLAFAGTPEPAAHVLRALLGQTPHTIASVYTQPDRPAGRGRKPRPSPVKSVAEEHGLPVRQPASARELELYEDLAENDVMVVVAYGLLLTETVLNRPRHGCINLHFSLLPRWRGAAPVQRAILAGDHETGISLMQMDTGLDTGPILAQVAEPIRPDDTTASLQARLADIGVTALVELLVHIGQAKARFQEESGVTYAAKIHKQEARLDWQSPAAELGRAVRAYNPAPVASAELAGMPCRIWEAAVLDTASSATPGTVTATGKKGIDVATGQGILRIQRLQVPGGKPVRAAEFLNGRPDFGKVSG